jgi:hypothetical protein
MSPEPGEVWLAGDNSTNWTPTPRYQGETLELEHHAQALIDEALETRR